MPECSSNSGLFFKHGTIVTVGIDLPDRSFAEDQAVVHAADAEEMLLELCGKGFPAHLKIDRGVKVIISGGEGRSLFSVRGVLRDRAVGRLLKIEIVDEVKVVERRAYTRTDVLVPVHYSLPASQDMGRVISEWQAFADAGAKSDHVAACSSSRVNLSGNGLRFKIRDCLSYGTLLHVRIALPGKDDAHIHAVGTIIRTKELLPEMNRLEYYSTSMSFRMIKSTDRLNLIRHIIEARHTA